jgi:hypothetical protein
LLAKTEQLDDCLTDRFDPQASCRQHFGRDAALLAQQAEQQVFGACVVVQVPVGFFGRILQRALAGRAERDLVGLGDFPTPREVTKDVAAKVVDEATGSREDPAAKPFAFIQHPEEDVLGLDGARSQLADLRARVEKNLNRS